MFSCTLLHFALLPFCLLEFWSIVDVICIDGEAKLRGNVVPQHKQCSQCCRVEGVGGGAGKSVL